MNPHYLLWALLILVSLWVSLGGFLWAHRHGQFRDQDRARFLPLRGEAAPQTPPDGQGTRRETLVVLAILAAGISAIAGAFITAMFRFPGGMP
jgi:nitrogen fixation-related uncharacterized protein